MKNGMGDILWKCIFPLLSVVLWILTIVLAFKANGSYQTGDYAAIQAIESALRWRPACCIGAIISTALSYVIMGLAKHFEKA